MNAVLACIGELPINELHSLYTQPASCLVVLAAVPDISKQIIVRLLYQPSSIDMNVISDWLSVAYQPMLSACVRQLVALQVAQYNKEQTTLTLCQQYKQSLQTALTHGQATAADVCVQGALPSKQQRSRTELQDYANTRWECLLQFLALPSEQSGTAVSVAMRLVLAHGQLILDGKNNSQVNITSNGFQFLLLDRSTQLWTYLRHCLLVGSDGSAVELCTMLSTLCRVLFVDCERAHKAEGLHEDLLMRMREIGLVYMRRRSDGWFYTTPMFKLLTAGQHGQTEANNEQLRFLTLDTNYRVYAYTDSQLQLSILSTFCDIMYRFSNMSVAVLTRDSVRNALQVGITAAQIVSYLKEHARLLSAEGDKPASLSTVNANPVPDTVSDQIRLWELERERLTYQDSTMYSVFESEDEFAALLSFCRRSDCLLWQVALVRFGGQMEFDSTHKLLVASSTHKEAIAKWFAKYKKTNR